MANTLKITLVKSVIGTRQSHRDTVRSLGLRRLHHSVERPDNPSVRGMVRKVAYLLRCEQAPNAESPPTALAPSAPAAPDTPPAPEPSTNP